MAKGKEELLEAIVSGGDERIILLENGKNKYFVNPVDFEQSVYRSSCTCNTLNPDSYEAVSALHRKMDKENFEAVIEDHRKRLKDVLCLQDEHSFEVFFAPSGSDLVYYPLLFQQLLSPQKQIHNLVTCPEELGSGSIMAAEGSYYFNFTQFGEKIEKGSSIGAVKTEMAYFPARAHNGRIYNHKEMIARELKDQEGKGSIIVNLVLGSKSGIEDDLTLIPEFQNDVMWVVDMCQMRVNKELINDMIQSGALIMITGSKFFQAPPFCGAMLVPNAWMNRLKAVKDVNTAAAVYNKIFSKYDIPPSLPELRNQFRNGQNHGLTLRWEAGLYEMEALDKLPYDVVLGTIDQWNSIITSYIARQSRVFEIMPDSEMTNKTIVSFRLKKNNGQYLTEPELRALYQRMSEEHFEILGNKHLLIGQPVSYGSKAFIRVAIGSYNIRTFIQHGLDQAYEEGIMNVIMNTLDAMYNTQEATMETGHAAS